MTASLVSLFWVHVSMQLINCGGTVWCCRSSSLVGLVKFTRLLRLLLEIWRRKKGTFRLMFYEACPEDNNALQRAVTEKSVQGSLWWLIRMTRSSPCPSYSCDPICGSASDEARTFLGYDYNNQSLSINVVEQMGITGAEAGKDEFMNWRWSTEWRGGCHKLSAYLILSCSCRSFMTFRDWCSGCKLQ